MRRIENVLQEEICELEKIIENVEKRLEHAPSGHLRITKKRGGVEYYYKEEACGKNQKDVCQANSKINNNGRYLKKREKNLAVKIAQRDYDTQVLKMTAERIKAIKTFLEKYEKTSLKRLYQQTNLYRKELINAEIISDEEYVRRWLSVEYKGKSFAEDAPEIITERGERVRSKSEKIIADKLYMLGVPYRYEYPLTLDGGIRIYPDFTILRMPEREEVYLEHFGMMDDIDYVGTVMQKLSTYERNAICLGEKLFITYETVKNPLNARNLDRLLRRLF